MSAIKCKHECKTLLDFSDTKRVSKNLVKQSLRKAEMPSYHSCDNELIHTDYDIIVGMYRIRLKLFLSDQNKSKTKLKDYGSFYIEVSEPYEEPGRRKIIWTESDRRFKSQNWSCRRNNMRINDLVNAIIYCNRLNNLKAFL